MYPTLVEAIENTVSGLGVFAPETSTRKFRIHATDLGEAVLLPPILARIAIDRPERRITSHATGLRCLRDGVATGVNGCGDLYVVDRSR